MKDLVVLLDVDNTLLDNDLVRTSLASRLSAVLGRQRTARFWEIYEEVRAETDVVDFPETLERFARECPDTACIGGVSAALYNFSFGRYLYPDSLRVIEHLSTFATSVILSDGDQLFQRYKIRVSGLEEAVAGNVLVYVHKEMHWGDIQRRFPASHYAIVDDKARIHAAAKEAQDENVTTVMVCQGKYADDPAHHEFPEADITIEGIGGLLALKEEELTRPRKRGDGRH